MSGQTCFLKRICGVIQGSDGCLLVKIVRVKHCVLQVGLVGCPNAGKSELTNRLVGQKVTAVSSKRNTTVDVHLGAFTEGLTQVALLDTPGIVEYRELRHTEHQARVKSAWRIAAGCNVLLLMVDADRQVGGGHRKACKPSNLI